MDVFNVGSINLDHVYQVPHFVQPGETLSASHYQRGLGGKGLNQTVALHRAGSTVRHIGAVGQDDHTTLTALQSLGLDTRGIDTVDASTGHAIIQVDTQAENCIVIHPGANARIDQQRIAAQLHQHPDTSWLLLQNETNATADVFALTQRYQRRLAFNPAPAHADLAALPLDALALLIVNRIELQQLSAHDEINLGLQALQRRCPNTEIVVTLGGNGAICAPAGAGSDAWQRCPIIPVSAVDTTGAGDTFVGYYLSSRIRQVPVATALQCASAAAALCVSHAGAVDAIPEQPAVQSLLESL